MAGKRMTASHQLSRSRRVLRTAGVGHSLPSRSAPTSDRLGREPPSEPGTKRKTFTTSRLKLVVAVPLSRSDADPVLPQPRGLRRNVDPVEASGVLAQDLALDLRGQIDVVLLLQLLRQLVRHELLDQPLGRPNGVVAAKKELFRAEPEQQIGHDLAEVFRSEMDKGHRH